MSARQIGLRSDRIGRWGDDLVIGGWKRASRRSADFGNYPSRNQGAQSSGTWIRGIDLSPRVASRIAQTGAYGWYRGGSRCRLRGADTWPVSCRLDCGTNGYCRVESGREVRVRALRAGSLLPSSYRPIGWSPGEFRDRDGRLPTDRAGLAPLISLLSPHPLQALRADRPSKAAP